MAALQPLAVLAPRLLAPSPDSQLSSDFGGLMGVDFLENAERGLCLLDGLEAIARAVQRFGQFPQVFAFPISIPPFADSPNRFFVLFYGSAEPP